GRAHDDELALGDQTAEGEKHGDEYADRQHDIEEARQDQQRQVQEHVDRQTAVDDQIDKPQRLSEPYGSAQRGRNKNHDAKALAEDVPIEPRHRRRIIGSTRRLGHRAFPARATLAPSSMLDYVSWIAGCARTHRLLRGWKMKISFDEP